MTTITSEEIVKISSCVMEQLRESYPNDEIELGFNWPLSVAVAYELGRKEQRESDADIADNLATPDGFSGSWIGEAIRNNTGE